MKRKAVFLDRDGTLIEEKNYLGDPADVVLIDGAAEALRQLSNEGFLLLMVTNQSGVARGYFTMLDVEKVNRRVQELLAKQYVNLDGIYVCPHYDMGKVPEYAIPCICRKPQPGMVLGAQRDWDLDLSTCYMIGDKLSDIQLGHNFGAKESFLVQTGYGTQTDQMKLDCVKVKSIQEAAANIIKRDREAL